MHLVWDVVSVSESAAFPALLEASVSPGPARTGRDPGKHGRVP